MKIWFDEWNSYDSNMTDDDDNDNFNSDNDDDNL